MGNSRSGPQNTGQNHHRVHQVHLGIDSKELEAGKLVFTAAPPTTAKGGNGAKLINR